MLLFKITYSNVSKEISKNRDYFQTHCNDRRNLFHMRVVTGIYIIIHNVIWYIYMNSYTNKSIYTQK